MSPFRYLSLLSMAIAAGSLACGSDDPAGVPTRTLEIVVVTSGDEADADGFTVQIDAEPSRSIGASEVLQAPDISPGNHTVFVAGVAENCAVEGANPRTISVPDQGTTRLTIQVLCAARTGSVRVAIRTRGPATYPPAYTVAVDGIEAAPVDTGRVLLEGIPPGPHVIELRGVPLQCRSHGNHFSITVRPGEVAGVEFFVECVGLQGSIVITTLASGSKLPDGFVFTVDGRNPTPIPPVAIRTVSVPPGSHTVELRQIPSHCQTEGRNPYPVDVPAASVGRVRFLVRCGRS